MKDMLESERFKKILERSGKTTKEETVAELVSIAQELMPEIWKGIQYDGSYDIPFEDIVKKVNKRHYEGFAENLSIEVLFLIFSSVAWHHEIVTNITHKGDFRLLLGFRFVKEGDKEPSVENCAAYWMWLYEFAEDVV